MWSILAGDTAQSSSNAYTHPDTYPHTDADAHRNSRPSCHNPPATNVASFSATLNGSLNPRGSTTMVNFQWGLTTSYGHTTPMQTQNGNAVRAISANISALSASHTYHFRIVAHNGGGTVFGNDGVFTTLTATGPPIVMTNPATNSGASRPRFMAHSIRTGWPLQFISSMARRPATGPPRPIRPGAGTRIRMWLPVSAA